MSDLLQERKNRSALASAKQRRAANPDKSVWVEASAGTGKTKVLSDRVLRLLLKGVPPAKILCLTYTKAAAVEMNTRIAGRLSRWAVVNDEELQAELENLLGEDFRAHSEEELAAKARKLFAILLDTPGGMKIQTIHSFCQEILKRFPLEAKISPYFEVMDDRSSHEALLEVKNRLLRKIEQEPESCVAMSLAYITTKVSEFTFPKIMNGIAASRNKIARLRTQYPSVEALIAATAQRLGVEEDDSAESLIIDYGQRLNRVENQRMMEALFKGSESDKKRAEVLAQVLSSDDFARNYEEYAGVFLKADGEIRAKLATKGALADYPEIEEKAIAIALSLQELNNKISAAALLASTKAVWYLAEDLINGYNTYKKLHSKLDYEDLIVLTRQLLENKSVAEWVLFKLDGGIDNVLIDEAQDTSPDQWAIIKAVTADFFDGHGVNEMTRTVFAVGDRKQSIYSFQGADPREFEKMRHYFAKKLVDSENFEEVKLDVSFRSTAAILDAVNNVFSSPNVKQGVVLADEDMTHTPSRIGDGGKVELWPVVEAEEGENPDVYLPPVERKIAGSTSSRLAMQIAERIRQMVEGKEILASQNRPIRYADFMVLVQRRNSFVEELVRACKNAGVNIAGVDKIKLLEQIAVQDLVAIARFLLLPTDDLTLATILKSPLFGLDDEDLFKLCYNRGGAPLWSRLGDFLEYREVYQTLQELLNMADMVRPFELYAHILNKLKGREKWVARLGYETIDGIDEFVNLTLDFEAQHIPSLQGFVSWIEKDEVEIKRELEQSDIDAVRIMTVHGSKGLQSPIVILPDTIRVKSIKNEAGLLMDDDLFYYPFNSDCYEDNCKKIKENEKIFSMEEYRRLLYVALTRAEERLCICGYARNAKINEDSWYAVCAQSLAQIGQVQADGGWCYEVAQGVENAPRKDRPKAESSVPDLAWIKTLPKEEGPMAKPLTPSRLEEEDELFASPLGKNSVNRYRRGQIIHKLLQFLPEIKSKDNSGLIETFLAKNGADLSVAAQKRIQKEVLDLIENSDFAAVFGNDSKAEVPLMGEVEGKIISGQIDRLVVEKDRVMIIDFKTNRPAAMSLEAVPKSYFKQLRAYKSLVAEIYPGKKVETWILWTDTAQLMLVD